MIYLPIKGAHYDRVKKYTITKTKQKGG